MHITGVSIIRGAAEPGVEVEFRSDEGGSVLIQLKSEALEKADDQTLIDHAKRVLSDVVAASESNAAA